MVKKIVLNQEEFPIPSLMKIDPEGLVESWGMEAEDWLLAYDGPKHLEPLEVKEGIVVLGKLSRTRRSLLEEVDVLGYFQQLNEALSDEAVMRYFIELPSHLIMPDIAAWCSDADRLSQEYEKDCRELAWSLVEDLDAFALLHWWQNKASKRATNPAKVEALVNCYSWLDLHSLDFWDCAPQVYAEAATFQDKIEDQPGLEASKMHYLVLLQNFDFFVGESPRSQEKALVNFLDLLDSLKREEGE